MASETRPGVEVLQALAETPVVTATPVLVPVVVGACHQIVPLTESDGSVNSDALYETAQYNQASVTIPQASFPDPRDNIDELEFDEDAIAVGLNFGGGLRTLPRGSGDSFGRAFLKALNTAARAGIRSTEADSFAFDSTNGDVLALAFDKVNPLDASDDVTVTLVGTLTAAEVVAEFNDAAGADVAEVFEDTAGDFGPAGAEYVQISSLTFGATSSVTVRAGTSALKKLFGSGFDDSVEYRVEGAGFHGQDDEDGDLLTPWVEFYRGGYFEDDADTTFPADNVADTLWAGLLNLDGDFTNAKASAVTYTGTSATVPLQAATTTVPGDQFWASGARVGGNTEVIKIESERFKLGKLNNSLSTFDDDGDPTTRVYDTIEVATENAAIPFAPKYAYFRADGLVFGSVIPAGTQASITGTETGLDARPAIVQSASDISFPVNLASLTLIHEVTVDGTSLGEETFTFTGGPFANIAALVSALTGEIEGVTVSSEGDRLVLTTDEEGADQAITIKSTGTANAALGFSTTSATEDEGKDVEFAEQAAIVSDPITLPLADLTSLALDLVVEDAKGTHALSATGVDLSAAIDLGDVVDAVAVAFGGTAVTDRTLYDSGIPVATVSSSGDSDASGSVTITTIEGGSSVTVALTATDDSDGFRFLGFYDTVGGKYAFEEAASVVTDFIDLRGLQVVPATAGFSLTTVGLAFDVAGTDITLTVGTFDMDELASDMTTTIDAVLVAAGNPTGLVIVAFDRAGDKFDITIAGTTSITIGAHSGTDLSATLFGPFTATQAGPTWSGSSPTTAYATVEVEYDDGTGPYTITDSATTAMVQTAVDAEALVQILNADADLNGATAVGSRVLVWYVASTGAVAVRTVEGGTGTSLDSTATTDGLDGMGFTTPFANTGTDSVENSDDDGDDGLLGTTLGFHLDDNPHTYEVSFSTNSLQDAIDEVNTTVNGSGDVASESSGAMVLTSLLKGVASKVEVDDDASYDADEVLGLSGSAVGTGRPDPDFYLDGDGSVNIGASILRNGTSGQPFTLPSALADIYVAYKALRLDVSASAENPSLLTFTSTTEIDEAIGPISTENPLALGCFLALANAPGSGVSALGIDEVSEAAPTGTLDGWARALEFLESREVYTIAPLTDDSYVLGLVSTHVQSLSQATNRSERIAFIWSPVPNRAVDVTVTSGTDGETNTSDDSFTLDVNPASDLIAAGIDPSDPIPFDDQLFLEVVVTTAGTTELRRYSVSEVNGVVLTLRTSFEDDENEDGFYTTETLLASLVLDGQSWSLKIRGDELVIAGTSRRDLNAVASAVAEQATPFASRRVYYLFLDSFDTSIDGVTTKVDGFYIAAAKAGMVAELAPQQPFTNVPIVGVGQVYGTDDTFSENQMDTIADGGRYVVVNQGGRGASRHSRSTSTTSIESRELSITKAIDWLAKGLRATNRVFIGRFVITRGFLDQLTMANEGFLDLSEQLGVVTEAALKSILQDTNNPDTVLVEVEVEPAFPCNKIKITIVS